MLSTVLHLAIWPTLSLATTHNVNVGNKGLNFEPNILYNIAIGDAVNFHFYPSNHSVAESTFDAPCKPKDDIDDNKPIYSGFVPVSNGVANKMWSITVNTTDPIWLYCSQGEHQHCRGGQAMVINPRNDSDQTLDAYMESAKNANVSSPDEVFGGVLITEDKGQPGGGPQATPPANSSASTASMTSASVSASSSSTATAKSTNGVAPVREDLVWQLSSWILLGAVFLVTL